MRFHHLAIAALASAVCWGTANASLISADGGLAVYDTDQNITWLANANLAATNTYGVSGINPDGSMAWTTAETWLAAINSSNYLGINSWRFPDTPFPELVPVGNGYYQSTHNPDPTCANASPAAGSESVGEGCTGSEMGYLYYTELGCLAGGFTNPACFSPFQNVTVNPIGLFWSVEIGAGYPIAFQFAFINGNQIYQGVDVSSEGSAGAVWAVTSGNPFNAVPVPPTAFLFTSALGLLGLRRRKH